MFFSGCASKHSSSDYVSNIQIPEWVTNPSKNGIIGGVGYCAAHINGYAGQKELASKRALEDIARQKGVLVNSIMHVSSKFSNISIIYECTFYIHTFLPFLIFFIIHSFIGKSQFLLSFLLSFSKVLHN